MAYIQKQPGDPTTVPKRKASRATRIANGAALQGMVEYRAFEWPKGSGRTWRVLPVSHLQAIPLVELEIEQLEISEAFSAYADARKKGEGDTATLAAVSRRWADWCGRVAAVAGPLLIPTWPYRSRLAYRLLRRLGLLRIRRNPLRGAPQNDLAEILSFLSQCRTSSGAGIRPLGAPG